MDDKATQEALFDLLPPYRDPPDFIYASTKLRPAIEQWAEEHPDSTLIGTIDKIHWVESIAERRARSKSGL